MKIVKGVRGSFAPESGPEGWVPPILYENYKVSGKVLSSRRLMKTSVPPMEHVPDPVQTAVSLHGCDAIRPPLYGLAAVVRLLEGPSLGPALTFLGVTGGRITAGGS
jgi:hypothetical protein